MNSEHPDPERRAEPNQNALRRFCAAYYDEWVVSVLSGQNRPTLSAGICRSLEAAVGEAALEDFLAEEQEKGRLETIADYKSADWKDPVWLLKDYM